MKVCYFGNFDPKYIRAAVLIAGLKKNGVEVIFCRDDSKGIQKYIKLFFAHRKIRGTYDVLFVGNHDFSRSMVILAKLLTKKKIVWDAHYSLYDARVNDRKQIPKRSLKALYHWSLEWLACKLADVILLDTQNHVDYFAQLFKAKKEKFGYVFIGADDEAFYPVANNKRTDKKFIVEFHGKFIPLQGVPYIIKAAKLLEAHTDIQFQIIGNGQTYAEVIAVAKKLDVKNVEFIDKIPYDQVLTYITNADVCLGIFGDTGKATRVIPNKLYEAVAAGKAVITADTPAIRELFTNGEAF